MAKKLREVGKMFSAANIKTMSDAMDSISSAVGTMKGMIAQMGESGKPAARFHLTESDMSFEAKQCAVEDAIELLLGIPEGSDLDICVCDMYDAYAVYCVRNLKHWAPMDECPMYRIDYSIDANGQVTLGTPSEVEKVMTYEPVAAGESMREAEAMTKAEGGSNFPASDYAYVPSKFKPSTWKLRLTKTPGGEPDAGIVGAAAAALGAGFRGQKVQIPEADLPAVKAKVRAAWKKVNPDKKPADMPAGIAEAGALDIVGDCVALVEQAVRADGTVPIKVIQPGWGSSGYYSSAILERDGPSVFKAGLHMYLDHPTAQEEAARPERSVKDLAATFITDATWRAQGPAGPGLYADAKVLPAYQEAINALAPHIGVSIRASGKATQGQADGRKGPIIEAITSAQSVDFVTVPGAGGKVLQLFEAARGGQTIINQEVHTVDEQEAKALREAHATLEAENARLREREVLRQARDIVVEALAKVEMPALTRARLTETLAKSPMVKDGKLDVDGFTASIQEAVKGELAYLAGISGSGQIRGMGAGSGNAGENKAPLLERYKDLYRQQGNSPEVAQRMAEASVQGR